MNPSSKNEKILSIITVVKNDEENIYNTVKSVISQQSVDFEYIIFDGCSKDNTQKIIKKFKSKKIKYFRKRDKNLYDAINKAIKLSNGKYIGLLHSGDIFCRKNHLKNIVKLCKKNPDFISGNIAYYENVENKIQTTRIWRKPFNRINIFSIFKIPHTSLYIKKNLIKNFGYYNIQYNISSDLDFTLKLIDIKNLKFYYIDKFFLLMKNNGLSTSKKFFLRKLYQDISILFKNYNIFFFIIYFYKILIKIPGCFISTKLNLHSNYKR